MMTVSQGFLGEVEIPGSKSLTHRALIMAALAEGESVIKQPLLCEDTELTLEALKTLGAKIQTEDGSLRVVGTGGRLLESGPEIHLKNSGTSVRLLTSVACLSSGSWVLTGSERMQQRPIQPLLDALSSLGAGVESVNHTGCPPVLTKGGGIRGGQTSVSASKSSQYLSSLLLAAPYADSDVVIRVSDSVSSWPYVELTLMMMKQFGIEVEHLGQTLFKIPGGQAYQGREITIEGDCSSAAYFWAAAAVTRKRIVTRNIKPFSIQPDFAFLSTLGNMGCEIELGPDFVAVTGARLSGVEVDFNSTPDQVPTLAVLAALADNTTLIKNVAHLRHKESDRLSDLAFELNKLGASVEVLEDGLAIKGGRFTGGVADPHDDHRLAMSFAVAKLTAPGIEIMNPECVVKSFPNFWELFEGLAV